ncbi:hypothetical protein [Micromonospora tarensis]|uniref:SmpA / OmlA family protein n=1 Tax=Micromonospora tarensis TaxID=2806100 RepID=A0ABS1YKT2_9ACTN|nr:hypothetical protein [Micromonospora tarensis]MBM0278043.1 hypothetical protein [Micromonospora tarensis]
MELFGRPHIAGCLVCRKRVWFSRRAMEVDADFARRLLRLLGSLETETDIPSISRYRTRKWLVHWVCWEAHADKAQVVYAERHAEEQRRATARAEADGPAFVPAARSRPAAGGIELVAGMSKQDVVRLIGEPIRKTSVQDFLDAQLSVHSLDGAFSNVEYWFFDVLPTPGQVLRIAFGEGRVLGIEEFDWEG